MSSEIRSEGCLIEPQQERGELTIDGPVLFCVNPGEAGALGRVAEKNGAKRHFLYNSNLWRISGETNFHLCGPAIGAPMAVMTLEKLIALGGHKFIVFGTCGALSSQLEIGDVLLPTEAFSEEGTSAHYPQPGRPASSCSLRGALLKVIKEAELRGVEGSLWTTDAPYRETNAKVDYYVGQGASGVDMEFSALATVAAFREVDLAAVLVVSDHLKNGLWEPGFHRKDFKTKLKRVGELLLNFCSGGCEL